MKNWKITGILATLMILLSPPLYLLKVRYAEPGAVQDIQRQAEFVGRDRCVGCHREQYKA